MVRLGVRVFSRRHRVSVIARAVIAGDRFDVDDWQRGYRLICRRGTVKIHESVKPAPLFECAQVGACGIGPS